MIPFYIRWLQQLTCSFYPSLASSPLLLSCVKLVLTFLVLAPPCLCMGGSVPLVLKQFAQETGGRAFFPNAATELDGIYTLIADELAAQYALAYSSRNPRRDGQWRRIVVRTTRPELAARTKQGYFGPVN